MSTYFLARPNDLKLDGLRADDDTRAAHVQHSIWRAHNMPTVRKTEREIQDGKRRECGPFTLLSGWLMCKGEAVRDRASWRTARILDVDNDDASRLIKFDDNGAEARYKVHHLEVREADGDVELIFRNWYQAFEEHQFQIKLRSAYASPIGWFMIFGLL